MKTLNASWDGAKDRWELIDDRDEWSISKPRVVAGRIRNISKMPCFPPMVQIVRYGDARPDWVTFYINESKLGDASDGDTVWALVYQIPNSGPSLACAEFNVIAK